jgi:hypothetical protein
MNFTMEIYNLLVRYTKDSEGIHITVAQLQNLGWWRCVWGWWRAKASYKMDGYYERSEDVPEDLQDYTIMTDKLKAHTFMFNGRKVVQRMAVETCKSIYG